MVIAVTGSASGIGAEVRSQLEASGHEVIGVDLSGAEVTADLMTAAGRSAAIGAVTDSCGGVLDGLVTCAGIGAADAESKIVALNYFGSVELLAGLRPALAAAVAPAAVAISSNSITTVPLIPDALVDACLAGDEAAALEVADQHPGYGYSGSKLSVARWVRRQATSDDWAGAGITLNAVAPGATMTPLLQVTLDDPATADAVRAFPVPMGDFASPADIAPMVVFLLGPQARFICGSVMFVDGGSDAVIRPNDLPSSYEPTAEQIQRLMGE